MGRWPSRSCLSSHQIIATNATTIATTKKVMRCDENQSSSWPLSRMNSSEPKVRPSRPKPRKSSLMPPFCDSCHLLLHIGRIFDDARGEEQGDQADGDVEEEDPAPVEVVRDVAAERGTDGGRAHDSQAIHGEGLTTFFRRERVGEDRLLGGRKSAAADALKNAAEDQERQRGSKAAQRGADAERVRRRSCRTSCAR
jgi:hypothetical protein